MTRQRTVYGVVLAAGAGRRMGGPKALLRSAAGPLVGRHVQYMRAADCVRVVVVAASAVALRLRAVLAAEAGVDVLGVSTETPFASLRAAYDHLGAPREEALLITHVDRLPAAPATLRRICAALTSNVDVVTPRHQGHSGHPIAVRAQCLSAPFDTLRALVRSPHLRRVVVDVGDAAVLVNLNDPAAFERTFGEPPSFLW